MDRINLIAGALVEICCCCLKQNFSDVAEDGEGIALFFFPLQKTLFWYLKWRAVGAHLEVYFLTKQ